MSANFQKTREVIVETARRNRGAQGVRPLADLSGVAQARTVPGRASTMLSGGSGASAPTTATNKLLGR